jgi:hypothetical protein
MHAPTYEVRVDEFGQSWQSAPGFPFPTEDDKNVAELDDVIGRPKFDDVIGRPELDDVIGTFRPPAFHFHFPAKTAEADDRGGVSASTSGILSKLDDMLDYLKSIGND